MCTYIYILQATAHATGCRPEHKTFQKHFMHVPFTLIHIRQLSCNFSMQLYQATVMQLYQATFMQLFHATLSGNFQEDPEVSGFIFIQATRFVQRISCFAVVYRATARRIQSGHLGIKIGMCGGTYGQDWEA